MELSRDYDMQLENFSPARVLEKRLAEVMGIRVLPQDSARSGGQNL
jgi:hypothetical protein